MGLAAAFALWGNKMDLSIWPADAENSSLDVFANILHAADENLLHDDTDELAEHCMWLRDRGWGKIDIIVDNAGFELVTVSIRFLIVICHCNSGYNLSLLQDLALADYLIASGVAEKVTFQLKSHPTFVSDALERDVIETIEHYASLPEDKYPNARAAGIRWQQYLKGV